MNKIIDKVCHIPTMKELMHGNFKTTKDPFMYTGRDTLATTAASGNSGFKNLSEIEHVVQN